MNVLISPSGQRVRVDNVHAFALSHGLDRGNLWRVIVGERQHHKGWRSTCAVGFEGRKPYAVERYLVDHEKATKA